MDSDERLTPETSDAELVARGRAGDDSALDELVRRHHESAYRVALSVVREHDMAQDVVQDGFVRAFRALDRFRGDAAFRTWLLTIVANEGRGALRKRGRRRETGLDGVAPVASRERDAADRVAIEDEAARARRHVQSLPEKQRLSVMLRVDEGLSFREIGELIGSSEGAARVNYFHGIRKLRELMDA